MISPTATALRADVIATAAAEAEWATQEGRRTSRRPSRPRTRLAGTDLTKHDTSLCHSFSFFLYSSYDNTPTFYASIPFGRSLYLASPHCIVVRCWPTGMQP